MYRYGWNLGTGNLVTGVFINLVLVGLGMTLLGEKVNIVNAIGIAFCILGVALSAIALDRTYQGYSSKERIGAIRHISVCLSASPGPIW
jgi:hypothetical protein